MSAGTIEHGTPRPAPSLPPAPQCPHPTDRIRPASGQAPPTHHHTASTCTHLVLAVALEALVVPGHESALHEHIGLEPLLIRDAVADLRLKPPAVVGGPVAARGWGGERGRGVQGGCEGRGVGKGREGSDRTVHSTHTHLPRSPARHTHTPVPPVVVVHVEAPQLAAVEQLLERVAPCACACSETVAAAVWRQLKGGVRNQWEDNGDDRLVPAKQPMSFTPTQTPRSPVWGPTFNGLERRGLALLAVVDRLKGGQHDALAVACSSSSRAARQAVNEYVGSPG